MTAPSPRAGTDDQIERPTPRIKPVWPFVLMAVLSPVISLVVNIAFQVLFHYVLNRWFFHISGSSSASIYNALLVVVTIGLLVTGVTVAVKRSMANAKSRAHQAPSPIGHTTDGQPIYPVVGYTPSGQAVTADRAIGLQPAAVGTNSMAIAALILGLTVAPLGIIFGHIALSQIGQTRQAGRGLAIAGLVLGYISVASILTAGLVYVAP